MGDITNKAVHGKYVKSEPLSALHCQKAEPTWLWPTELKFENKESTALVSVLIKKTNEAYRGNICMFCVYRPTSVFTLDPL